MKNQNISNTKKELLSLKPFRVDSYRSLDLDSLVVYGLYALEEKKVPLYFDFIAVALFRLFPKKFSMASFAQYPDSNRISKAVRRLTDQKRKRWATGNIGNGFFLTDLGHEMARQVLTTIENPGLRKKTKPLLVTKSRGRSPADDMKEIKESDAFMKWQNNQEVNNHEFFAFLKAASYTPKQLLDEHLKELKNSAVTMKDREVLKFLSWLENKFKSLLQ